MTNELKDQVDSDQRYRIHLFDSLILKSKWKKEINLLVA